MGENKLRRIFRTKAKYIDNYKIIRLIADFFFFSSYVEIIKIWFAIREREKFSFIDL